MPWTVQAYMDTGASDQFETFEEAIEKAAALRDEGIMIHFHAPAEATDEQLQAFVDLFGPEAPSVKR
ncbi:hypothetical protein [Rhizobium sp. HT1-10]|uniref:hypothetical protein n=1 Tax=Rhizobium sp. HT1-10 TaxID=3111638 RepID=UPI003C21CA36